MCKTTGLKAFAFGGEFMSVAPILVPVSKQKDIVSQTSSIQFKEQWVVVWSWGRYGHAGAVGVLKC